MIARILAIVILFLNISGVSKESVSVTAESAILMDPLTRRIIYSKNPHKKLPPASTAKIMTALVVLKKGRLDREVKVSKFASSMEPSKIYIKDGEAYLMKDLLKAILMNSGNDASVALAEAVSGSEKAFVDKMNQTARAVGARDTNFKNSSGLPAKGQYSTAYDLALMVRSAMKDRTFVDIMKMRYSEIEEINSSRRIKLRNHNKSLWRDTSYQILGKTGYTIKAGHCFAGYIRYNKWRKVIVVILKSKKMWSDMEILAGRGKR